MAREDLEERLALPTYAKTARAMIEGAMGRLPNQWPDQDRDNNRSKKR